MSIVVEILALFCLTIGLFFMLVGAIGVVRLPDAYHRLHAASKCSTLGILGLLLGAVFHIGALDVLTKSTMMVMFAFVATPVGSHILAKAALLDRCHKWEGTISDEHEKDDKKKRDAA